MEDFVPFEIAKKLAEKGFDLKTRCGYLPPMKRILESFTDKDWTKSNGYSAPTLSQVLKWLRNEKEIDIVIYPIDGCTLFMGGEKYILSVYIRRKRDYKLHHDNKDKYVKWEDAALVDINYVLYNLI